MRILYCVLDNEFPAQGKALDVAYGAFEREIAA